MKIPLGRNAMRPAPGTWLHAKLARDTHPDVFRCGVRVVSGAVPGERARWTFRVSAVDRLQPAPDLRTLNHGEGLSLRLRIDPAQRPRPSASRPEHSVFDAVETTTGARLEVSAPTGELARFGVG